MLNYPSTLEGTAPTGDKAAGFSTGRTTVDWTNRFSHTFSAVTPFASAGLANTVSDTSFFIRPFTSLGIVSHFEGGAKLRVSQFIDVGTSAYAWSVGTTENHQQNFPEHAGADIIIGFNECWERKESAI